MQSDNNLDDLSFSEIVLHCKKETERYFRKQSFDNRYCFKLFQIALIEQDQQAWDALYEQYKPLVLAWLQQGNRLFYVEEHVDALVNETFAKFWSAVSPEKFRNFDSLSAILRYLKTCAGSVLLDRIRNQGRPNYSELKEDVLTDNAENLDKRVHEQELLEQIDQRLKDDDEKLVFFAMFTLGMKPSEVQDEWSERFETIGRINQIRQNIVGRLRRDKGLRRYYN